MHLDKRTAQLLCLGLWLLLSGGMMTACAQAGDMPDRFQFAFGNEYTLKKEGEIVTIDHRKTWSDAQRPPQDSLLADDTPASVRIDAQEARRIWKAIAALDLAPYKQPDDQDFEPTPPDMRHTERLLLRIDGKTVVDWSRSYQFLKPQLRAPLAAVEALIGEVYEKTAAK